MAVFRELGSRKSWCHRYNAVFDWSFPSVVVRDSLDRYAWTIFGFHGCKPEFAERLFRGEISIEDWKPSENDYDWLGHGIYFWEHAPERALHWRGKGGVVGAIIQLGNCLDLTDLQFTGLLSSEFEVVRKAHADEGLKLPANTDKRRDLDCLVINRLAKSAEDSGIVFDTVRCPFLEGEPAFEGSHIFRESHIQIVVRTPASIAGIFRPNLPSRGGDS